MTAEDAARDFGGHRPPLQFQMYPVNLHSLFPRKAIVKEQFLVPAAVLVHEPGHFHVETTILGDLEKPAFPPPANGVQSRGGFLNAEGGVCDRAQPEAVTNAL